MHAQMRLHVFMTMHPAGSRSHRDESTALNEITRPPHPPPLSVHVGESGQLLNSSTSLMLEGELTVGYVKVLELRKLNGKGSDWCRG